MKLTWKDALATVILAAVVVPYIGYVTQGSMPFVQDPTGMAGLGLFLGAVATVVGGWILVRSGTLLGALTSLMGLAAAGLGITALISEEYLASDVREPVLAAFIATLIALWAVATMAHAAGIRSDRRLPAFGRQTVRS